MNLLTKKKAPLRDRLQFRRLSVKPYEPKEFLPGLADDDDVDVSNFSGQHYDVTFEVREGDEGKWEKVSART